jgi:hypothetical protein
MKWRWDQGRLSYFQYENLKAIAHCLKRLESVQINQINFDPLRVELENWTRLPFSPKSYTVWRNYKRVFECSFLATNINNNLFVTDFCNKIVDDGIDVDEFLTLFIPRFRFPFAAFSDYQKTENLVYPFCALLKFLLARFLVGKQPSISLEEVFAYIIGNNCNGFEPITHYENLHNTNLKPIGEESRQVREMLIFVSQLSILKWFNGRLVLDICTKDYEDYNGFQLLTTPHYSESKAVREEEYLSVTSLNNEFIYPFKLQSREIPTDNIFIEGKRSRAIHIKIERSPLLRKLFLEQHPETICDMCVSDMHIRYPWTDNILEIHHILPLSSSLMITTRGTSLEDIAGLCPNCHKSVHTYYKNWLNRYKLDDFRNRNEAQEIYHEAKTRIMR